MQTKRLKTNILNFLNVSMWSTIQNTCLMCREKTGRKCNAKVTTIRMPLRWSGGMKSPSAIDMQEFYRLRYPLS